MGLDTSKWSMCFAHPLNIINPVPPALLNPSPIPNTTVDPSFHSRYSSLQHRVSQRPRMLPLVLLFPSMIVNRSVSLDTILVWKGAMERENRCTKCPVLQPCCSTTIEQAGRHAGY